ncbi:uncharacterized protein LOC9301969 [Arabidopsis lyrata subsp. lyrata]|uniref:uncharacterized protein LOC9301969 n=1 Tax=Arabidopsis lyrata subsp. lyrata TaxID=81972 RepID=UPI000A29DAAB|nr:uncharacterized protein LOC9301969 [Arabidopsis lyrata subsp. lyrata]|eukprot:XP_020880579.1 uncharacterized protein LOC9301969 [Arabidopsis lyrata subsp. lyrata]
MRVRMQSNQMEMDEAFAASLLYDDLPELMVAREWQNMQDYSLISLSDDENFAKSLQEQELNRSSSHQQSHVHGSFSDDSSDSFLSPPPDVDNMSYEENRLGRSTKDCRRREFAKYQPINFALPRRLERTITYPKKLSKIIVNIFSLMYE